MALEKAGAGSGGAGANGALWSGLRAVALACLILPCGIAHAATKTIKIGVLTDLSGVYADVTGPGSIHAAQMAADDFNAQSKSFKAEIVSADHQNKPDVGSAVVRKWFDRDGVDAVADVGNSAVALAVNELARQYNKVFVNSGSSSSDFTGKACSPNQFHWTYDTYALATGTTRAIVEEGGNSWFLLVADYAFGHAMERDVRRVLDSKGAKVVGEARHPLGTPDFSSFLLQAQSSHANTIALINAGGDTVNSIKQAAEFGVGGHGQRLAAMVLYLTDVHALGLKLAQGLQFTAAFYWDLNPGTRAWSKRFAEGMNGKYPTELQAGAYAAVFHYLKSVEAVGATTDGKAIVANLESRPLKDPRLRRKHDPQGRPDASQHVPLRSEETRRVESALRLL